MKKILQYVVYGFFNPKPRNAVDAVADERYTFAKLDTFVECQMMNLSQE